MPFAIARQNNVKPNEANSNIGRCSNMMTSIKEFGRGAEVGFQDLVVAVGAESATVVVEDFSMS